MEEIERALPKGESRRHRNAGNDRDLLQMKHTRGKVE